MWVLEGAELAAAILAVFEEPGRLRCAVAFWGPSLAKRARARGAEVVLDISLGGTSRNALKAFGLRRNRLPRTDAAVTVLDGLHAKVFLGERRAIVGSANASRAALGSPGRAPALKEVGVVVNRGTDPEGYARVEAIYGEYRGLSRPITPEDLDRAVRAPTNPAARDHGTGGSGGRDSPLELVLRRPERLSSAYFIFADDRIEPPELEAAEGAYGVQLGEPPAASRRSHICTVDDEDIDAGLRGASVVVMYWFGSGSGIYAYRDVVRIEHGDSDASYFGRRDWVRVRNGFGMAPITLDEAWSRDEELAGRLADTDGQAVTQRFVGFRPDRLFEIVEREVGRSDPQGGS